MVQQFERIFSKSHLTLHNTNSRNTLWTPLHALQRLSGLERTLNLRRDLVLFELAAFHTILMIKKNGKKLGNEDDLCIVFALTPGEREG
jgi:hypothetical protein